MDIVFLTSLLLMSQFLLLVCVVYPCMHGCRDMLPCVDTGEGQTFMPGCFLCFPAVLLLFESRSIIEPEAICSASSQDPLWLGCRHMPPPLGLSVGVAHPHTGPHTCTAGALCTESSTPALTLLYASALEIQPEKTSLRG